MWILEQGKQLYGIGVDRQVVMLVDRGSYVRPSEGGGPAGKSKSKAQGSIYLY